MARRLFQVSLILLIITGLTACTEDDPLIPDTDPRDKYAGNWNVSEETDGQATGTYPSVITEDTSNTSQILIHNIYNLGNSVSVAAIAGGNSLDISPQNAGGILISGSGVYSGSAFILNYTADDGSGAKNIRATYSR